MNKATKPRGRRWTVAGVLLIALLSGGCASYTSRMAQTRLDYVNGNYDGSLASIDPSDCESGVDRLIFLLERANIKQTMGDYEGSNADFEEAYRVIRRYEDRADLSVRDTLSEGGSLLTNETVLPYKGSGFEKLLLHGFKAINFLMLGNLEGARVEIRRLDDRLKQERQEYERMIRLAEEKAEEENLNREEISAAEEKLRNAFGGAISQVSNTTDSYLSAFGSFLSGLVYDIEGDFSEARIDSVRVAGLSPGFTYALRDAYFFGEEMAPPPSASGLDLRDCGDLVLFYQCGLTPIKKEVYLPIPTSRGYIATAFAVYRTIPTKLSRAVVLIDGVEAARTEILTDVEAQAIRTLVDEIPYTIIRAILRMVVKATLLNAAGQEGGEWGELAASIYNLASEQADLRSWLTLPKNIQALRIYPPEGTHRVRIALTGRGEEILWRSEEQEIEFRNNRMVLLNLRAIGYTPLLPNAVNVTEQISTISRVSLADRPRTILPPSQTSAKERIE